MATVVAALTSVIIGATPAAASAGWTVTPGGDADGDAGVTVLTVRPADGGADQVLDCLGSHADITAFSSPDSHVADIDNITFDDCLLAGLISFDVNAATPWSLHALGYNAPVVAGEIRDIEADIVGPGCQATVAGTVTGDYNNDTHQLTVVPNFSLTITFVDATDNCLGLLHVNDTAAFDGVYDVSPAQEILPA
ncbi:hypothetical protein [Actinophytocola sediminis]